LPLLNSQDTESNEKNTKKLIAKSNKFHCFMPSECDIEVEGVDMKSAEENLFNHFVRAAYFLLIKL
jgi:hypothetical protein